MQVTAGYGGEDLIFVMGCPRSGTTWLQMLLSSHPRIKTGPESHIFDGIVGPQLRKWEGDLRSAKEGRPPNGLPSYFNEVEFKELLRSYVHELFGPITKRLRQNELFLEKTPNHALFIPEIVELFPSSRIVYILRDARDVVASLLRSHAGWGKHWAPSNVWRAARMWTRYTEAQISAVKSFGGSRLFVVRYEELRESPIKSLQRILDFLDLEWGETDVLSAVSRCSAESLKRNGMTQIPVRGESAKNAGAFLRLPDGFVGNATTGNWRRSLSPYQKLVVWKVARKTMKNAGYEWRYPW